MKNIQHDWFMRVGRLTMQGDSWLLLTMAVGLSIAALWNCRVIAHDLLQISSSSRQLERAVTLLPLDAVPYTKLAELEPQREITNLRSALERNPRDTANSLRLSADLEIVGNVKSAGDVLIAASLRDLGLRPRWALANFYMRNGNKAKVFEIINGYRQTNSQVNPSLLRLAVDSSANLDEAFDQLPNLSCSELSTLLLLADERNLSATELPRKQGLCSDKSSRQSLERHVSYLLGKDQFQSASLQWENTGFTDTLFNANFERPISEEGFDWRQNRASEITMTQTSTEDGVDFQISPEAISGTVLLFQPVVLQPQRHYQLSVTVPNRDAAVHCLTAEVVEMTTGVVLASGLNKISDWEDDKASWNFIAPLSKRTLAVAFVYTRPDGSGPKNTEIQLIHTAMRLLPT